MPAPAIAFSNVSVTLKPAPIRPEWVLSGNPVTRNAEISRGTAAKAPTFIWDCTAGVFNWFYDTDETVHILEGSVLLQQDDGPTRRVGPGDVVFFPRGSSARWQVDDYVRKLAFFTPILPRPVETLMQVLRRAKRVLRPNGGAGGNWTSMGAGADEVQGA